MAIAEFIYQGAKTNIQSYFEEKMEDILQKLCTIVMVLVRLMDMEQQ